MLKFVDLSCIYSTLISQKISNFHKYTCMNYFGTDGIRGLATKDLNKTLLKKLAKAIVKYYRINNLKNVLLVGNDSRISSSYILAEISSVLLKNGIKVDNLGICSSPCLAYTTKKFGYPLSLMISASHNPSEYNGIKFFNSNGEKVDDAFEEQIETFMDSNIKLENKCFCLAKNVEILKQDYINFLQKLKKFNFSCILDCANGGTSEICKHVFTNQEQINNKPNGLNINLNSGCTHLEMLKNICIKNHKLGFAFDGDGDRLIVIDELGNIVNGDKILYILSNFFQNYNDVLVGTIYTNSALEKALKIKNIKLLRANVGDKNVYQQMKKNNSILGGEESGHIILKPFTNTGDGVLIAILIGNLIALSKKSLNELLLDYNEEFQIRENLRISKDQIESIKLENLANNFNTKNARVIIRPSGTEPVLRIFVESKNKNEAISTITKIKKKILELLN